MQRSITKTFNGLSSLLISAFLLSTTLGFAQALTYGPILYPGITGNIGGIDQSANNGYYLVANSSSTNVTLIRTLRERSTLNSWRVTSPTGIQATDVVALKNGCAVYGPTGNGNIALIRIDSNGNQLWSRLYPIGGTLIANSLQVNNKGQFLFCCLMASTGTLGPTLVLADSLGDVIWAKRISGNNVNQFRGTAFCRDGGVLITGAFQGELYYAKLSASGSTLWQKTYNGSGAEGGLNIIELANDDIAIVGYNYASTSRYGFILRATADGSLLWARAARGINGYFLNVAEAQGGTLQVSGDQDFGGRTNVFLASFAANGTYQSALAFNPNTSFNSFQGRGKSHLIDRAGVVHLMGTGRTTAGTNAPYWTSIEPSLTSSSCDARLLTLNPVSLGNSAPNSSINIAPLLLTPSIFNSTVTTIGICAAVSCNGETRQIRFLGLDKSFCSNSSFSTELDASAYTGTYQWSTGATTPSITVSQQGTYFVTVTSPCGILRDTINLFQYPTAPIPIVSPSGSLNFCVGQSVRLRARNNLSSLPLIWNTGATSDSITVSTSGTYNVSVFTSQGCKSISAPVTVQVSNPPPPTILPSATSFCAGGQVRLRVRGGVQGNTATWSNGVVDSVLTVSQAGTYSVTFRSPNGCEVTSGSVVITQRAVPDTPTVQASGPVSFCPGGSVTLSSVGVSPADSIRWNTGERQASLMVSQPGSYTVTATNAVGCSATSAQTVVSLFAAPAIPVITANRALSFCADSSVVLQVNGPSLADTVRWTTGATTRALTVNTSGTYGVQVGTVNGCKANAAPVTVTVRPLPATPLVVPRSPTNVCRGGQVRLAAGNVAPGNILRWSTGSADTAITVSVGGLYGLVASTPFGCMSTSESLQVIVRPTPPRPVLAATGPTTFCEGGSVRLRLQGLVATDSLLWSDGSRDSVLTVTQTGVYRVTLTNSVGCRSQVSAEVTVTVNRLPAIPILFAGGPINFCAGSQVQLYAFGVLTGDRIRWTTGAADTSIAVTTSGTYSFTVTTPAGCSRVSSSQTVVVRPLPAVPVITPVGPTTFCAGGQVRLRVPGRLASDSLLWNTGVRDTAITVSAAGTYGVTLTNAEGCNRNSATLAVTVNRQPAVPAIFPATALSLCTGGTVVLRARGVFAGDAIRWTTSSTDSVIQVSTSTANVSFTVTTPEGCTARSNEVNAVVRPTPPIPLITPSGPTTFCDGNQVTLSVNGLLTSDTVLWTTGITGSSVIVSTSGTYGLTVTNAERCSTTAIPVAVTVNRQPRTPVLSNTSPAPLCAAPGVDMRIDSIQAPDRLVWSTGDTTRLLRVVAAGSYYARITTAEGCTDTSNRLTVHPNPDAPVIQASGLTTFCHPGRVQMSIASVVAGDTWRWLQGPADSASFWVNTSGTFTLESTNSFGCKARSNEIGINVLPIARIRIDSSGALRFCQGGQVRLRLQGVLGGSTIRWSTGYTDTVTTVNTSNLVNALVTNPNGCPSFSDTASVVVWPLPLKPEIMANAPNRLCFGERLDLTAGALEPAVRLTWSTGEPDSLRIRIDTTGAYTLKVTNAFGCESVSDTFRIRFYDPTLPTLIVSTSTQIPCTGDSVVLVADGPDPIRWNTGYVGRQITVRTSDVFVARAGGVNTCLLPVSDTARVTIHPRPILEAGPDLDVCDGTETTIGSVSEQGVIYRWEPKGMLNSQEVAKPIFIAVNEDPQENTIRQVYRFIGTYSETGCTTLDSLTTTVHSRFQLTQEGTPYCLEGTILIPNLVTANGDNKNSQFAIAALQYYQESTLEIFNRFGLKVFSSSPYTNNWPSDNVLCGVYFYRLTIPKVNKEYKGWVEIIK